MWTGRLDSSQITPCCLSSLEKKQKRGERGIFMKKLTKMLIIWMRPSLPLSLLLHQEKRKIRNHGILYVILNRKFGGQITPVNGFNRGRNTIFPTHTTRKSSYEKKLFTIHSQSIPIKKEETIKSQFSAQLIIINVIFFYL